MGYFKIIFKELLEDPYSFFRKRFYYQNPLLYLFVKLVKFVLIILFLPFSVIIFFTKYRHAKIFSMRVGHFLLESLCLLNDPNSQKHKVIICIDKNICSNSYFITKLQSNFIVITNSLLSILVQSVFFY